MEYSSPKSFWNKKGHYGDIFFSFFFIYSGRPALEVRVSIGSRVWNKNSRSCLDRIVFKVSVHVSPQSWNKKGCIGFIFSLFFLHLFWTEGRKRYKCQTDLIDWKNSNNIFLFQFREREENNCFGMKSSWSFLIGDWTVSLVGVGVKLENAG